MPRLSHFYGIAIYMYYRDHAPPHFHAIYGGEETVIEIDSCGIIEGDLPRRAGRLVADWCSLYQLELNENWNRAIAGLQLLPIPPLT